MCIKVTKCLNDKIIVKSFDKEINENVFNIIAKCFNDKVIVKNFNEEIIIKKFDKKVNNKFNNEINVIEKDFFVC